MKVLSTSGDTVLTSVDAIEALVPWRCMMSPVIRWEKKFIGRWRIFHI